MPLSARILVAGSVVFGVAGVWFGVSRGGVPTGAAGSSPDQHLEDTKPPTSGFEPAFVDLGKVPWGTTSTIPLALWNRGAEDIPIAEIKTSCSCAVVGGVSALVGTTIPPGESREIEVQIDIGRRSGPAERDVWIDTHAGKSYWAKIKYDVQAGWIVLPANVNFGDVLITSKEPVSTTVKYRSGAAAITKLEPTENWFRVRREAVGDDRPWEDLTFEVTPTDISPGRHVAALRVFTTDPAVPEEKLLVSIEGITDLVPFPPESWLRPGGEKLVRFIDQDRKSPRIVSASVNAPANSASAEVVDGSVVRVTATESIPVNGFLLEVKDEAGRYGRAVIRIIKNAELLRTSKSEGD